MSADEKNKGFPIKITNFINPHVFQFKLENIVGQFDIDVEQKLRQNVEDGSRAAFNPEQGAMVAAYIVPWGKWVRGEVDLIIEENKSSQYIVWCLDHGVPMKLPSHHLRPIPKDLQDLSPNSYTGGLAKCVPIEKTLNFATMTYDVHITDDFPEYLVANAKQMVDEAAEIYFIPRQTMGNHIFGDISITKYSGTKVNLLNELTRTDSVKVGDTAIAKGIEEMRTIKKQRYENHLGHLNIRNVVNIETTSRVQKCNMSAISVCTPELDDEDKMILDWSRQNNEVAKKMERDLKEQFENVLRTLDVYEMSRNYLYRSTSSVNTLNSSSSLNILSRISSMTTIGEMATVPEPSENDDRKMSRLRERLAAASLNSMSMSKPKPKKQPKKTVAYIPSGFESDLVNFHKYNQFY